MGAIIGGAGGMTTAGAKIFDYLQSSENNTAVRSFLDTVESLCNEVQKHRKMLP